MQTDIIIRSREALAMTGVREVLGFDSDFITVMTDCGKVEIEGSELKILAMSAETGKLEVAGGIDGVYYSKPPKEKRWLFRGAK